MLEISLVERSSLSRRVRACSTHGREEVRGGSIIIGEEEKEIVIRTTGGNNRGGDVTEKGGDISDKDWG